MARNTKQADMMREQGWMLASEAAELIGYHPTSIYKLIRKEKLESTKVGGTIYVSTESLRTFLGTSADQFLGPA
jgi:excisionase family DNA binding protein